MLNSLKILKQVRSQKTQKEIADILGVDAKQYPAGRMALLLPPQWLGLR